VGAHCCGKNAGHDQAGQTSGKVIHHKAGKELIPRNAFRGEPRRPDGNANEQEQAELKDHHDP